MIFWLGYIVIVLNVFLLFIYYYGIVLFLFWLMKFVYYFLIKSFFFILVMNFYKDLKKVKNENYNCIIWIYNV